MAQILHNEHTLHLLNYLFLFAFSLRLSFCLLQAPPALQAQIDMLLWAQRVAGWAGFVWGEIKPERTNVGPATCTCLKSHCQRNQISKCLRLGCSSLPAATSAVAGGVVDYIF